MKKILYINYMIQYGHINFDMIHLSGLVNAGYDVDYIAFGKIVNKMQLPKEIHIQTLPKFLEIDSENGILNRLFYIFTLLYIKIFKKIRRYDSIIISNIDEISLGLVPLKDGMNIICHNLSDSFNSKIKLSFIKKLSRNSIFIVFNENMKIPFLKHGMNNLKIVSHGCLPPYEKTSYEFPCEIKDAKNIIFHPSQRPNIEFLKKILSDDSIQKTLEDLDAYLLFRDKSKNFSSKGRIIITSEYLSVTCYRNIFVNSDIILLAYPDNFQYKISGVSYECFSNRKKMLILSNPTFDYCKQYYNYDPFFHDVTEFAEKIKMLLSDSKYAFVTTEETIQPNYSKILF